MFELMDYAAMATVFEEMAIAFLPNLLIAIVIYLVAYFVAKLVARIIIRIGKKGGLGRSNVYHLLASAAKMAIMGFGLLSSLGTVGIDVTPLIAGLGLSGLALGLALKDAVTNLLNGILILIYEPFKEGDVVKISNARGRVGEINLRYIQVIDEENGKEYLVPNSLAFAKEIEKDWGSKDEATDS